MTNKLSRGTKGCRERRALCGGRSAGIQGNAGRVRTLINITDTAKNNSSFKHASSVWMFVKVAKTLALKRNSNYHPTDFYLTCFAMTVKQVNRKTHSDFHIVHYLSAIKETAIFKLATYFIDYFTVVYFVLVLLLFVRAFIA